MRGQDEGAPACRIGKGEAPLEGEAVEEVPHYSGRHPLPRHQEARLLKDSTSEVPQRCAALAMALFELVEARVANRNHALLHLLAEGLRSEHHWAGHGAVEARLNGLTKRFFALEKFCEGIAGKKTYIYFQIATLRTGSRTLRLLVANHNEGVSANLHYEQDCWFLIQMLLQNLINSNLQKFHSTLFYYLRQFGIPKHVISRLFEFVMWASIGIRSSATAELCNEQMKT